MFQFYFFVEGVDLVLDVPDPGRALVMLGCDDDEVGVSCDVGVVIAG